MNRDRLLISSAMLTSLCEVQKKDNLSLIEPFVLMSIALTTKYNETINCDRVLEKLREEYTFAEMPPAVLTKVLNRLSDIVPKEQRVLAKEGMSFRLLKDLTNERTSFEAEERKVNSEIEFVIEKLRLWLQSSLPSQKTDKASLTKLISDFFESQGCDILFVFDEIRSSTISNSDKINYQIGRFIIDAKENDPALFEMILRIVQGMMLASAIYIDTKPASSFVEKRGVNGTNVFLDTTLVIYAMGYKTQAQEDAAGHLIRLLRNGGANLLIFPQHFAEMKDILFAFENRKASKRPLQTLERLESEAWTTTEINTEIMFLEKRLKDVLGITVYAGNQYLREDGSLYNAEGAYIDSESLKSHIKSIIPNYGRDDSRLQNDVDAVSSIVAQREGMRFERLESCLSIFVTTNYSLIRECNTFLKYFKYKQIISPIISDVDLTTLLWLKSGCTDPSIPRLQLVRHATAAVSATDGVLSVFFQTIQNLERKGGISQDEAVYMRYDIFARKEIMELCKGDISSISEESVYEIIHKIRKKYSDEAEAETIKAKNQLDEERKKSDTEVRELVFQNDLLHKDFTKAQSIANDSRIEAQELKKRNQDARDSLYTCAEKSAHSRADKATNIVLGGLKLLLIIVTIICVITMFQSGYASVSGILSIIVGILSGLSAFNLCWPMFAFAKKIKPTVNTKFFDHYYNIEFSKIENQIKILRGEYVK